MLEALVGKYNVKVDAMEMGCILEFRFKDGKLNGKKLKLKKPPQSKSPKPPRSPKGP
jgi:hypothetical protein